MMVQIVGSGKKGQMKIQQMAFLLIVLTLFFVLAGLFMLSVGMSNLKDAKIELEEKNAMETVSRLANYPEISCEKAFDIQKSSCVDFDKIMAFQDVADDYSRFWRVNAIEIRKVYPEMEGEVVCTRQNYPECNYFKILSNGDTTGFDRSKYVSLCRKDFLYGMSYNKCELAKLIVRFGDE